MLGFYRRAPDGFIELEAVLSSTRTWRSPAHCRPLQRGEEEDDDILY
jgi:hypothetical protein